MFSKGIVCPSYAAQKELGYKSNLQEILEKECPQCPYGPNSGLKANRGPVRHVVPSLGEYIY